MGTGTIVSSGKAQSLQGSIIDRIEAFSRRQVWVILIVEGAFETASSFGPA
jgi:hypothetical protein